MVSIVAILTSVELFSYFGRVEREDYVQGLRHDVARAVLGFAELWGLGDSQVQRLNDFNNQKATLAPAQHFPWSVLFYL